MVAEGQACSAARSSARLQPWGQRSWAGAAQNWATPQLAAFSLKNKRDPICWPRPEVCPCLNPLVYQCRASSGSPPVKNLPTLSPLRVEGSGSSSTGPPSIPPHHRHVAMWPVQYGRPVYSSWFGCKQQHRLSTMGVSRGRTSCPSINKISRVWPKRQLRDSPPEPRRHMFIQDNKPSRLDLECSLILSGLFL